MLCYAMLCYAMLCYAMLCYAMLCYAMLCYAMLYYRAWITASGNCKCTAGSTADDVDMVGQLKKLQLKLTTLAQYNLQLMAALNGRLLFNANGLVMIVLAEALPELCLKITCMDIPGSGR